MRRKINITNSKFGKEQIQSVYDDIASDDTYLPKGISFSDIDRSLVDLVENKLDFRVGDEKLPVFFMSIQKWSEFTKSWGSSDEFKDVKLPFSTIVRDPNIQSGSNQDGLWNIPGVRTYSYRNVPTLINGRVGYDKYKIPQPTATDLTFHFRFFCNRMVELNNIHTKIQTTFNARQHYINVKGHPMPVVLEAISDESEIDDVESRRYYVMDFELLVKGYILDEKDFIITPAKDRAILFFDGDGSGKSINSLSIKESINKNGNSVKYEILSKYKASNIQEIIINQNTTINNISNEFNISEITFKVNGVIQEIFPFNLKRSDILQVELLKEDDTIGSLILNGTIT